MDCKYCRKGSNMTTTAKQTPTNNEIFCMIAATVEMYHEDKMTMDEALYFIVDIAKDVV